LQQQLEFLFSNKEALNNIRFLALKIFIESFYGPMLTEKKTASVLTKHIVTSVSQEEKSPMADKLMIIFKLCNDLLTQLPESEGEIIERLEYVLRFVKNHSKLLNSKDKLDLVDALLGLLKKNIPTT
jgi:hypothetical protein